MPLKTIIALGETEAYFQVLTEYLPGYRVIPVLQKDWKKMERYFPGLVLFYQAGPIHRSLELLEKQPWVRKIPTLLIHANTKMAAKDIAAAYESGIVDCISLPLNKDLLQQKIAASYRPMSWLRRLFSRRTIEKRVFKVAGIVPPPYTMNTEQESASTQVLTKGLYAKFFGAFRLYFDQKLLPDTLSKKDKNLLAYFLFHHGQFLHRDQLMELFWPDVMPDAARNSLHVAISHLRSYLRPYLGKIKVIKHQNEGYIFDPDHVVITDVKQFKASCHSGWEALKNQKYDAALPYLQQASNLYTKEFLREFLYEEWSSREREALQEALLAVLKSLALHYQKQGTYEQVIPLAERMLLIAPFLEDVHRLLIEAFAELNMRGRALHQYQKCRTLLMSHFEVEPSPETENLVAKLRVS
ncbi:MAG: winged helix-turn-helix domain-containing protein [Saprospiraceae bacterium]|nr:winged helix-turn-helix domain-containing protein [Saprospiraceae bacterium]